MLLRAYTLHDVKAVSYSPPFFVQNDAMATRMVKDLVADTNTTVGRHPADYKLYCIGHFDDTSAQLQPLNIMEHVVDCIALVPPPQPSMFSPEQLLKLQMLGNAGPFANGEAK